MTSLDEFLERIILTIYRNWFAPDLAGERSRFDAARAGLAQQLAALTPDDRAAADLLITAFLQDLALLPTIGQLADADLTAALSLRRGGGTRVTDVSAERLAALQALLAAENPPLFVLSRLRYRDRTPQHLFGEPAAPPENELIGTLANVLEALRAGGDALPETSRQQVAKLMQQFSSAVQTAVDGVSVVAKERVVELLDALAALPTMLPLVYAALLAGKTDDDRQSRGGLTTRGGQIDNRLAVSTRLEGLLSGQTEATSATTDSGTIDFLVKITFPAKPAIGRPHPLIVELVLQPDPNADTQQVRYLDKRVRLRRAELAGGLALQASLTTQAFTETTGDLTRTLMVNAAGTVTPAVFVLTARGKAGAAAIGVRLEQIVAEAAFATEITAMRGALEDFEKSFSVDFSASPAEPITTVAYQSVANFPAEVEPQSEHPLIVRLQRLLEAAAPGQGDATLQFSSTEDAKLVEVVVSAPAFADATQCWRRTMRVWRDRDSQPVVFWLTAGSEAGKMPLTVDFYHAGRMLGSVTYESEITSDVTNASARAQRISPINQLDAPPADPPDPADLTLRITKNEQTNTLHFVLHSPDPALGYDQREMGQVALNANPRRFLTDTFDQLSRMARQAVRKVDTLSETDTAVEEKELVRIGENLFEKLFPEALRNEYWRLKELREQGVIRSLLIISDEPWIPWEIVKPYQYDEKTDSDLTDDFLAVAFELCRWLAGRGPLADLHVDAASVVIPELDLAYVQQEKQYFEGLKGRGLRVADPLQSRDDVLDAVHEGEFQVLHLAAHGNFNPDKVDQSPLVLQDRQELWPSDLSGSQVRALRRQRPIVFLNACHSGQIEFSLTGLGGWAEQMVSTIGVGAFIGSLWEVNDLLAAEFATFFYDQLIAGEPLSAAFRAARSHIRQRQPSNPTWLAYTLYGDPNGRTEWGVS
ncbi:MAG: CHAT domain-containing protein [Caldilineaceae bacterium]